MHLKWVIYNCKIELFWSLSIDNSNFFFFNFEIIKIRVFLNDILIVLYDENMQKYSTYIKLAHSKHRNFHSILLRQALLQNIWNERKKQHSNKMFRQICLLISTIFSHTFMNKNEFSSKKKCIKNREQHYFSASISRQTGSRISIRNQFERNKCVNKRVICKLLNSNFIASFAFALLKLHVRGRKNVPIDECDSINNVMECSMEVVFFSFIFILVRIRWCLFLYKCFFSSFLERVHRTNI